MDDKPTMLPATTEVGAISAVAREQSEIQAQVLAAKKFPRDENAAIVRIQKAFARPGMAAKAQYSYERGGKPVVGPSVAAARELARCWGNIRAGSRIVSIDETYVHVKGQAFDLETNTYQETEAKFERLVQRKRGWIKPDERELRELANKQCSICERNATLRIIPKDVVDDAMATARATLRKQAAGKLKESREDTVKGIAVGFDTLGVTIEMLEQRLCHPLSLVNEDEVVELRGIYESIKDGNTDRRDYFDLGPVAPKSSKKTDDLNEQLGLKEKKEAAIEWLPKDEEDDA